MQEFMQVHPTYSNMLKYALNVRDVFLQSSYHSAELRPPPTRAKVMPLPMYPKGPYFGKMYHSKYTNKIKIN